MKRRRFGLQRVLLLAAQISRASIARSTPDTPMPLCVPPLASTASAEPDRRNASLDAIDRGNLTMQGPLRLPTGEHVMLFRMPIFVPNVADPNETFGCGGVGQWGASAR